MNIVARIKFSNNLKKSSPEIGYYSYTNRWNTFSEKLTKIASQLRCSRPFGNVFHRPAKPNY